METKDIEKKAKKVEKKPLEKVCLICAKGSLEDVYASLVMANGAVMEGIETNVFFTFFGLDGITKKAMNHLHTATTGNPVGTYMLGMMYSKDHSLLQPCL